MHAGTGSYRRNNVVQRCVTETYISSFVIRHYDVWYDAWRLTEHYLERHIKQHIIFTS